MWSGPQIWNELRDLAGALLLFGGMLAILLLILRGIRKY